MSFFALYFIKLIKSDSVDSYSTLLKKKNWSKRTLLKKKNWSKRTVHQSILKKIV